jgi:uncharacterized protein YceH (UPF0502 family)
LTLQLSSKLVLLGQQRREKQWLGPHQASGIISFVNIFLNETEARVLGALLEKEITTPDYYPLSLNALVNACNQKSNRDPVMTLDENSVRAALRTLHDNSLVRSVSAADSRVTKYEHRLQEAFNFDRREAAIFCELLVRGPQTPGELRTRAERMNPMADLSEAQSALQRLMNREPALVKVLARQPGTKESRYMHLLSGEPKPITATADHESQAKPERAAPAQTEKYAELDRLFSEVAGLRQEVADLKQQLATFRKQFE